MPSTYVGAIKVNESKIQLEDFEAGPIIIVPIQRNAKIIRTKARYVQVINVQLKLS